MEIYHALCLSEKLVVFEVKTKVKHRTTTKSKKKKKDANETTSKAKTEEPRRRSVTLRHFPLVDFTGDCIPSVL